MRLKIFGDNPTLWQWDTGQKLIVEDNGICREVHFCNNYSDKALVLPIMEQDGIRVVDVPNILLQEASMLTAYLFSYDANGSETKFVYRFSVRPRPKPDSYIYTETEVLNYASIDKRLNYLEQNQLLGGGFIASDVAPEDTSVLWIDTDEDEVDNLQNIISEALAQAKVSGEFDGKDGKDGYTPVKGVDYFDGKDGVDGKDGYTPQKGVDYFDGADGKDGQNGSDYVLTEADKQEIAEQAAQLVDIPEGGSAESVQYTEQSLSEEQQMQARKNLGLYGITYEYDLLRQEGPNYAGYVWTLDPLPETIDGDYRVEIWDVSPSQLRFAANLQREGHRRESMSGGSDICWFWGNPSLIKNDSEAAEIFSEYTDNVNDCPIVLYRALHEDYWYDFTRLYISPDLQPSYFLGFNVKIMSTVPHQVVNQIPEEYIPSSIAVQCVEQSLTEEQQMQARKNLGLYSTFEEPAQFYKGIIDGEYIDGSGGGFSTVENATVYIGGDKHICQKQGDIEKWSNEGMYWVGNFDLIPEGNRSWQYKDYTETLYSDLPFVIYNSVLDGGDTNIISGRYSGDKEYGQVTAFDNDRVVIKTTTIPEEYLPDSILNTINNEVVKHTEQSLTEEQQMQARKNLGLYGSREEFVTLGEIKHVFGGETVDLAGYAIHAGLDLDTTKPLVMELFDNHANITIHSATYYPQGEDYFDPNQYTDCNYWYWGNHSLLQNDTTAWQYLSYYQDKNGYDDAPFVICSLFDENLGRYRKLILSPDLEYPGGGGYTVILRSTEKETVYDKIPHDYIPTADWGYVGGVKADPVTEEDTQPVRIGNDGKLYTAPTGVGSGSGIIFSDTEPDDTSVLWIDTDDNEADDLQAAIDDALAQAKASGEFDGADGKDGKDGQDGYTPQKGVDYFDGQPGADGKDYVLTEADKQEIAELTAPLVDVPESGGGSDYTLVANLTTEEEVAELLFNTDVNGQPFAFSEMWAICNVTPTAAADGSTTTDGDFYVIPNKYWAVGTTLGRAKLNSGWAHLLICHMQFREGLFWGVDHASSTGTSYFAPPGVQQNISKDTHLNSIRFVMQKQRIKPGSQFLIFGK